MSANTNLSEYSGVLDAKHLSHLLKRTLFGTSKIDLQNHNGKNLDSILNSLLIKAPDPLPPIVNYTNG